MELRSTSNIESKWQDPPEKKGKRFYWFAGVPNHYKIPKRYEYKESGGSHSSVQSAFHVTPFTVLKGFLTYSSSAGVAQIRETNGIVKKIIWSCVFIATLVALSIHIWWLAAGYMQFNVIANVDIVPSRSLRFPAVTVCNSSPMKLSGIPASMVAIINKSRTDSVMLSKAVLIDRISEEYSYMTAAQKEAASFSLSDLILFCSFNGEDCNMSSDFWSYHDSTYGLCHTFNSGKIPGVTPVDSTLAGEIYGLTLVLNIQLYEYIGYLAEDAGARITIDDQGDMPFPAYTGLSVGTGQVNKIALRQVVNTRLDGVYGNCTSPDSAAENAWAEKYQTNYTLWSCLTTCYQKALVKNCSCFDSDVPYNSSSPIFSSIPSATGGPCGTEDEKETSCLSKLLDSFNSGAIPCDLCFLPCSETLFEITRSSSVWPASSYMNDFVNLLNHRFPHLVSHLNKTYPTMSDAIKSNMLKLNIFYDDLLTTEYHERPSYGPFAFVADLGGAFGFWIGWSILTLLELLEFLADLTVYGCLRACSSLKGRKC